MIYKAYVLGISAHSGHEDRGGRPYFSHPERIAARLFLALSTVASRLPDGFIGYVVASAFLHDTLEDSDLKPEDLEKEGIPADLCATVVRLSRNYSAAATYQLWIKEIAGSDDLIAVLTKYGDNVDNSLQERIDTLPPEQRSIVNRYNKARPVLRESALSLLTKLLGDAEVAESVLAIIDVHSIASPALTPQQIASLERPPASLPSPVR